MLSVKDCFFYYIYQHNKVINKFRSRENELILINSHLNVTEINFTLHQVFSSDISIIDDIVRLETARHRTISKYIAVAPLLGSWQPDEFGIVLADFGSKLGRQQYLLFSIEQGIQGVTPLGNDWPVSAKKS